MAALMINKAVYTRIHVLPDGSVFTHANPFSRSSEGDPELKQETSHSLMASMDFNKQVGRCYLGLFVEVFYTRLVDGFANEFGKPDAEGTVIQTRNNSEGGATVQGMNLE